MGKNSTGHPVSSSVEEAKLKVLRSTWKYPKSTKTFVVLLNYFPWSPWPTKHKINHFWKLLPLIIEVTDAREETPKQTKNKKSHFQNDFPWSLRRQMQVSWQKINDNGPWCTPLLLSPLTWWGWCTPLFHHPSLLMHAHIPVIRVSNGLVAFDQPRSVA